MTKSEGTNKSLPEHLDESTSARAESNKKEDGRKFRGNKSVDAEDKSSTISCSTLQRIKTNQTKISANEPDLDERIKAKQVDKLLQRQESAGDDSNSKKTTKTRRGRTHAASMPAGSSVVRGVDFGEKTTPRRRNNLHRRRTTEDDGGLNGLNSRARRDRDTPLHSSMPDNTGPMFTEAGKMIVESSGSEMLENSSGVDELQRFDKINLDQKVATRRGKMDRSSRGASMPVNSNFKCSVICSEGSDHLLTLDEKIALKNARSGGLKKAWSCEGLANLTLDEKIARKSTKLSNGQKETRPYSALTNLGEVAGSESNSKAEWNVLIEESETATDIPVTTWTCLKCTYINAVISNHCKICNEEKGQTTRFSLMGVPEVFEESSDSLLQIMEDKTPIRDRDLAPVAPSFRRKLAIFDKKVHDAYGENMKCSKPNTITGQANNEINKSTAASQPSVHNKPALSHSDISNVKGIIEAANNIAALAVDDKFEEKVHRKMKGKQTSNSACTDASARGSWEKRLQQKLSAETREDAKISAGTKTTAESSYEERLKRKLSAETQEDAKISAGTKTTAESSYEERLKRKLSAETQEDAKISAGTKTTAESSYEERLTRKLSAETQEDAKISAGIKNTTETSYEERLKRKLSAETQEDTKVSAGTKTTAETSYEERLKRKISLDTPAVKTGGYSGDRGSDNQSIEDPEDLDDDSWTCLKCTFVNQWSDLNCVICNEEKGKKTRFSLMDIPDVFN